MIFRTSHALGLDISDASLVALELSGAATKPKLQAVNRKKIPPGVVRDGEILKKDELVSALSDLFKKPRKGSFTTHDVVFSLPESKALSYIFHMPKNLSGERLSEGVLQEAEKTIPFSFKEVYADSLVVGQGEQSQDVLYVAAEKRIVDVFRETLAAAGLKPIACETESIALSRSLISEYHKDGATMIVDIGSRTTIVSVFDNGSLRWSENVPVAGAALTKAVGKTLSLTHTQAEDMKLRFGVGRTEEGKRIREAIEPLLGGIAERIQEAWRHYEGHSDRPVKDIVLAGGSSLLPGLEGWFRKRLKRTVRMGAAGTPVLFAAALGLAKRGLEPEKQNTYINLLPKS